MMSLREFVRGDLTFARQSPIVHILVRDGACLSHLLIACRACSHSIKECSTSPSRSSRACSTSSSGPASATCVFPLRRFSLLLSSLLTALVAPAEYARQHARERAHHQPVRLRVVQRRVHGWRSGCAVVPEDAWHGVHGHGNRCTVPRTRMPISSYPASLPTDDGPLIVWSFRGGRNYRTGRRNRHRRGNDLGHNWHHRRAVREPGHSIRVRSAQERRHILILVAVRWLSLVQLSNTYL